MGERIHCIDADIYKNDDGSFDCIWLRPFGDDELSIRRGCDYCYMMLEWKTKMAEEGWSNKKRVAHGEHPDWPGEWVCIGEIVDSAGTVMGYEAQWKLYKTLHEAEEAGWKLIYSYFKDGKEIYRKEKERMTKSESLEIHDPNAIQEFDYSLLDSDTATFLQEKANRITEIRIKSVVAIGKELKEAHDKLANNKNGTFESWVESLGISHKTSRNYINAYEYILKNFQHIEDAEKIQPSLLFAVSKPSAPKELQEAVLSGDITTHKQYKELECKLKEVEHAKKIAESQLNNVNVIKQQLEEQNRRLANEKHMAENEIQRLTKQLEQAKSYGNAEEVKNLQVTLKALEDEVTKLKNDKESLQKQLKDKPIEVPAVKIVEKVPEKSKYEVINRTYGTLLAAKLISKSDIEICREADFTRKNSIIEFLENLRDAIPEYLNILNEEVQQHKCEDCRFCDWEDLKEEDEAAGMIYCTLNEDKQLWYNNRACENFEEL